MKAFIMAGGKATRFGVPVEKGVLEVGGRTMLERAASTLRGAGIDHVFAAVTNATPATADLAKRVGVRPVLTGGHGYHDDILELLDEDDEFVTLNVDTPLVATNHVKALLPNAGRGSVTTVVPATLAISSPRKESLIRDADGSNMICVGLNIVTSNPDICLLVLDDSLLTVNVNDEQDLALANRLAERHGI